MLRFWLEDDGGKGRFWGLEFGPAGGGPWILPEAGRRGRGGRCFGGSSRSSTKGSSLLWWSFSSRKPLSSPICGGILSGEMRGYGTGGGKEGSAWVALEWD